MQVRTQCPLKTCSFERSVPSTGLVPGPPLGVTPDLPKQTLLHSVEMEQRGGGWGTVRTPTPVASANGVRSKNPQTLVKA